MTTPAAVKFDQQKPPIDLIEPSFLTGIANVLAHGADKYAAHNWRGGIETSRLYAATQRHLNAFWSGEDIDPESGLPHLYHAACSLMFLCWTTEVRSDLDDRWHRRASVEAL